MTGNATNELWHFIAALVLLSVVLAIGIAGLSSIVTTVNETGNYWWLLAVPVVLFVMALPLQFLEPNGEGSEGECGVPDQ